MCHKYLDCENTEKNLEEKEKNRDFDEKKIDKN